MIPAKDAFQASPAGASAFRSAFWLSRVPGSGFLHRKTGLGHFSFGFGLQLDLLSFAVLPTAPAQILRWPGCFRMRSAANSNLAALALRAMGKSPARLYGFPLPGAPVEVMIRARNFRCHWPPAE